MNALTHFDVDATRNPIVQLTDTNEAMADSRDVAAYFGKRHADVIRAVRFLHCTPTFRQRNFASINIKELSGAEVISHYRMTKNGFSFVVLGFTGEQAGIYKERYVEAFDVMEAELRRRREAVPLVPAMPGSYAAALRELAASVEVVERHQAQIATLAPKAEFVDRFVEAGGRYGLQNAGRALGCRPNKFIDWLKAAGFIFYADGSLVPRQQYLQAGIFEVKNTVGGDDKVHTQSFVTPKGISYFAARIPSHIKSHQPVPAPAETAMITH
ncbi:phage regulatory protein/antirepressor Ant [Tardiphaga sp.]|uniref:Rha family transcriptional regulator n=1 Tax=Tardiphaga sp. TaxID=1926292 RepID=UPI00262474E8|nr:phage regulatory protein/antirepressor Ant [Tardiphaga sp.]MDB5618540.1 hypothetical protein [Tardiphaga sp.]